MADITHIHNGVGVFTVRDTDAVHKTGNETVAGTKTMQDDVVFKQNLVMSQEGETVGLRARFKGLERKGTAFSRDSRLVTSVETESGDSVVEVVQSAGAWSSSYQVVFPEADGITRTVGLTVEKVAPNEVAIRGNGLGGASMPSGGCIDMTLPATSGSFVTFIQGVTGSPLSGWIMFKAIAAADNVAVVLATSGEGQTGPRSFEQRCVAQHSGDEISMIFPVAKGRQVRMTWNGTFRDASVFALFPANGEA